MKLMRLEIIGILYLENKHQPLIKTICQLGFRCGQQSSHPATTASGFGRKATRNPQLDIVPYVMANNKKTLQNEADK